MKVQIKKDKDYKLTLCIGKTLLRLSDYVLELYDSELETGEYEIKLVRIEKRGDQKYGNNKQTNK